MARRTPSQAWLQRQNADAYVKKRDEQGYPSRAAFKLQEINRRDRLIRSGMCLIELGASPGGWTKVAADIVGPSGNVVAVDILTMESVAGAVLIEGDCRTERVLKAVRAALSEQRVGLVMSDMAPNISGVAPADEAAACELGFTTLSYVRDFLQPGGSLLIKLFQFPETELIVDEISALFKDVRRRKPPASRAQSREFYVVAKQFGI